MQNEIKFGDQDILNIYFKDDWLQLSNKYNTQLQYLFLCEKSREKLEPCIIHFTGEYKPLDNINANNQYVTAIISLFRAYHTMNWADIVNMPLGTISLKLG